MSDNRLETEDDLFNDFQGDIGADQINTGFDERIIISPEQGFLNMREPLPAQPEIVVEPVGYFEDILMSTIRDSRGLPMVQLIDIYENTLDDVETLRQSGGFQYNTREQQLINEIFILIEQMQNQMANQMANRIGDVIAAMEDSMNLGQPQSFINGGLNQFTPEQNN